MYLCERDKDGRIITINVDEFNEEISQDPKWYFVKKWREYGLRDDLIEKLWRDFDGGR